MQILGFPVQVLGEPDVHSRHAHIIRTSWDDWQAGGKRGLPTRGAALSYQDRYSPSGPRGRARKAFMLQHQPIRASEAILCPQRRADNSGLSAYRPPAETHKRTAFYLSTCKA